MIHAAGLAFAPTFSPMPVFMMAAGRDPFEPRTWAGQESSSIAGYIARRALAGIGAGLAGLGTAGQGAYQYDPHALADKLSLMTIPGHDPNERKKAFAAKHKEQIDWAAKFAEDRLSLQTGAGRRTYEQLVDELKQLNGTARGSWDSLYESFAGLERLDPRGAVRLLAVPDLRLFNELMALLQEGYRLEREWQVACYEDLITSAYNAHHGGKTRYPPNDDDVAKVRKLSERYKEASIAHEEYFEKMREGDPTTRENARKQLDQKVLYALWDLNDAVRTMYEKMGHPGASKLRAPLTFTYRLQAYLISQGPNSMAAAEPYIEALWNLRSAVQKALKGEISLEEFSEVTAKGWALTTISVFYGNFRIGAPPGFPLFTHHIPESEGLGMFQNGLRLFTPQQGGDTHGLISNWPHTGSMDYAGILGASYLLGLPTASIVADQIFRYLPVMGDFIRKTGVFIDKSDTGPTYAAMAKRIEEGMMTAVFGTGTRAFEFPGIVSPFADLNHPGTLHMPGGYIPSRHMTGMPIRSAWGTGAPVLVFAADLHTGGIPEPSIPRSIGGFMGSRLMFQYARPGEQDGWVALAGLIPAGALIQPDEVEVNGATDERKTRWVALQQNAAVIRAIEMSAGWLMDAGPVVPT